MMWKFCTFLKAKCRRNLGANYVQDEPLPTDSAPRKRVAKKHLRAFIGRLVAMRQDPLSIGLIPPMTKMVDQY